MKINASLYYKRFSKRILRLEKIRKIGYIKIFFYFKKLSTRDMKVNLYNIYIFYPLIFFSTKQKSFPLLYFSTFPIKQLEGELKIFLSLHFSISSHFFISQSNGPLVSSSNSIQQGAPIFVPLHLYLLFLSFWQIQQTQHIHRIIVSHFLAFVEKKKRKENKSIQ